MEAFGWGDGFLLFGRIDFFAQVVGVESTSLLFRTVNQSSTSISSPPGRPWTAAALVGETTRLRVVFLATSPKTSKITRAAHLSLDLIPPQTNYEILTQNALPMNSHARLTWKSTCHAENAASGEWTPFALPRETPSKTACRVRKSCAKGLLGKSRQKLTPQERFKSQPGSAQSGIASQVLETGVKHKRQ